ncbi:MAG: UDP-N-acetylmuramoyl-L-alanyl-D-glutamate--2,6-diaminopimelate ligase [Bacillota bacterium]|jgi:UDP-N-acetylmuramoyl-L-alanyl-D-glutamate--2,6-diaminopimelate ligase|nr:UDP-N-acetylmuramoyl-L-alanyl-D-glutamate--2,6-diaminopimelate ligase [Bacillota bacterium]
MGIPLKSLLQGIEIVSVEGLETPITGIHYDSRQVKPGFIFVAIKGFRTDGHFYLNEALARGARGLLVEREVPVPPGVAWARVKNTRRALASLAANFYNHPSRKLTLIGVTGTNGKTTTTHLIEAVLRARGTRTGLIGTVWNKIGEKKLSVLHTTPESLELQALLREMVDSGVGAVAMEVSSHGLVLERTAECEFDVGVFTNLTQDHLDFHKDLKDYLTAKMLLFTGLGRNRTKKRPCYAVVNLDDAAGEEIARSVKPPVITYGIREKADVKAEDIKLSARGTAFTVMYQKQEIPFSLSLPGEFNIYNALAAICVGLQEGIEVSSLQETLQKAKGVPGRFEVIDQGQSFTVVVDYAHTPDGLENILRTSRTLTQGKVLTVFGCGGDRDPGKRPLMGRIAAELSDFTIITSDNPRSEDPGKILTQIEAGLKQIGGARYLVIEDRYEAIRAALHQAQAGDFVVIAGKGHEGYQIIGDKVIPFNDRLVAQEIITKEILS